MGLFGRLFAFSFGEPEEEGKLAKLTQGLYKKLFLETDRIKAIKGISKELDSEIEVLKDHVLEFNKKMDMVKDILESKSATDVIRLQDEVKKIRKLIHLEEKDDRLEDRHVIRILSVIDNLIDNETDRIVLNEEEHIRDYLNELREDVEKLEPCLVHQLQHFDLSPLEQQKHLKDLMFSIQEEAAIIGYEESIISNLHKEIDKFEIEAIMHDKT
jgi:hypothetical protein